MNNLSYTQRALLRRRGIVVCIERADGIAKCQTAHGPRIYTIDDLRTMAQPGIGERLRNWIAGSRAA